MPMLKFLLTPYQRRKLERQQRTDQHGSPVYALNLPATGPAAYQEYAISSQYPAAHKYAPLDWIEVVNNDTVDLQLMINGAGGDIYLVPSSSTRVVKKTPFEFYRITNLDAAVTSTLGAIRVSMQKAALDADTVAAREV